MHRFPLRTLRPEAVASDRDRATSNVLRERTFDFWGSRMLGVRFLEIDKREQHKLRARLGSG